MVGGVVSRPEPTDAVGVVTLPGLTDMVGVVTIPGPTDIVGVVTLPGLTDIVGKGRGGGSAAGLAVRASRVALNGSRPVRSGLTGSMGPAVNVLRVNGAEDVVPVRGTGVPPAVVFGMLGEAANADVARGKASTTKATRWGRRDTGRFLPLARRTLCSGGWIGDGRSGARRMRQRCELVHRRSNMRFFALG